ncbi:MAG: signal peptidase II [bacterium]
MSSNIKKMIAVNLAVIFFIGLDRFFKVFIFNNQASEFNLLGEILKFNFKNNYNIAFSLPLSGSWLSAMILLIILLLIFYLAQAWRKKEIALEVGLLMVILGASSNLYDRLKYGFVVDYFDLKYFTVFNLADFLIVAGVLFLLVILNKKEAN